MKVKLYHHPGTRSARVAWLLQELGTLVDVEIVRLDLYRAEQYLDGFMTAFPLHAVPAVEITLPDRQPVRMTESGAILVALADAFPSSNLSPPASPLSELRAEFLMMIHACAASFDMMLWQVRIHEHVLDPDQRDQRTIDRYRRKFSGEVVPMLATRLSQAEYICGERFSAADCMIGHLLIWARMYGLADDPAIRKYLSRISKRPAFATAFADAHEVQLMVPANSATRPIFTG
jgi:glutathione S-transferase